MEWARECEAKTWGKDLTKAQLLQKSAFTSQHYQTVMRNMIHFYFPHGILKPKVISVQHSQLRPVNVQWFDFLPLMKLLLSRKDVVERANWQFSMKKNANGHRIYGEPYTTNMWRDAEKSMKHKLKRQGLSDVEITRHLLAHTTLPQLLLVVVRSKARN